jgi:phosphohistidine phosphatase SixA
MRHLISILALSLLLAALCSDVFAQSPPSAQTKQLFQGAAPAASHALSGKALLAALKQGGYVLYFRHTATDFSKNDSRMQGLDDCANQRPLSDRGRAQAKEIGAAIRKLQLPIGDVQASPYCRTVETATLAFGKTERNIAVRGDGGNYDALGTLLSEAAPAKSNRAVVGHGNGMRALAGAPHLDEGEAAVIKPGKSGPVIVARIRVTDWEGLDKP